jgi:hypothetical protein
MQPSGDLRVQPPVTLTRNIFAATAAILIGASACSSTPTKPTPPSAAPANSAATPTPTMPSPQAEGDVTTDDTTFHLKVTKVREAPTYTDGYRQAQKAGAGNKLIIVTLSEKNTGKEPGNLERGTPSPMSLTAADGATYATGVTWSNPDSVNPGLTQKNTYVFEVPSAVKPASITVTLLTGGGDGVTPSLVLALPA